MTAQPDPKPLALPPEIFKAYDIRGIVGQSLTPEGVERIGLAFGSTIREQGGTQVVVGRDGRLSGQELVDALIRGLRDAGVDVAYLGPVTTPMTYFAAHHLGCGHAVMVTGSHNPPDYNGLKLVLDNAALSGDAIQALRQRCERGDFTRGRGALHAHDIFPAYLARIRSDLRLARPMKVVLDAGNGIAGAYAPALFEALGCVVDPLFCEVDGHFPNHHPDPSEPANLVQLIARLQAGDAELGLAFDGDGDRLGVVTRAGIIIYPDRLLMALAADVLARHPGGTVIYDVKSSGRLHGWIRDHGGQPLLWKTGHSVLKAKMRETGALLAGEVSGHMFFAERWYGFDDGLYAGARLLEILSCHPDPGAVLEALPESLSTPELHIPMAEGAPHALIDSLRAQARFEGAREVIHLDGLRVEYPDGFGLVRASNTTPVVVLRFEAEDASALARIQADFRRVLNQALPGVALPF
ncbi:MAG: phosphomannomutase/phosphoglucomutase [Pseudomonadota bacterium]